jgi:hypothetical protein
MRQKRQKLTSASWLRPVCGGFHNLTHFNCAPFFASCCRHRVLTVTCLETCRCAAYLRRKLSSPAQLLGSWVRIPLKAWMSVCVYSVFVLSCVQGAALRRADPPSKESYRLCKRSWNWKSGQGPTKGCRAIDRSYVLMKIFTPSHKCYSVLSYNFICTTYLDNRVTSMQLQLWYI